MKQHVLFEGQQDTGFLDEIAALPEGERVLSCLQCGTCSATCPVAPLLEEPPRRIFAMIRAGMRKEVLGSLTPWMCSSCYECTVRCPAQIKITEIMYALKRKSIRERMVTHDSDVHRFYKIFTEIVSKYGRMNEMMLLMRYMMFNHPMELASQMPVGMRMFTTGTLQIQPHKVKNQDSFNKIVQKAVSLEE
jgi:heterodisulfide reductase subunit C